MSDPLRLLVVDDATDYARMVAEFIRVTDVGANAVVDTAASYEAALRAFEQAPYDVAFFDYLLGSHDGLALLREVRRRGIQTPVIVMTGHGAEDVAVDAMKAGAVDYLGKTAVTPETIGAAIRHAIALKAEERQRQQAEAALRASEERFRALVENSSDALLLVDGEGRVTYVTPSSERHLGWQPGERIGKSLFDVLHPEDRELVGAQIDDALQRPGERVTAEVRFQHGDGTWRCMEAVGVNRLDDPSVGAIVINARDVTERQRLEGQLREAQKTEAVGRLAAGVAHDFNNLLTAILGYCDLMLEDVGPENPLRHDLEEVRIAAERATTLTGQLLAFTRGQILQPQAVDLNALVAGMETTLRRLIGEDIELAFIFASDLPAIRADPGSIEQVIVSLAVNARDAMSAGGLLTIATADVQIHETDVEGQPSVVPGRYVMMTVSDTGEGMDAATRAQLFEPFFTTKEPGKGSGLGLATVTRILKETGGAARVQSEPGHGTVFKVFLPILRSSAMERPDETMTRSDDRRGWETVLLVEEEDAVRALAREVLRRHGYVVIEARRGLDALRIAERHPSPIQLLVVDVNLPHMTGRDLADRLSSVRPDIKVLFLSGFADQAVMDRDPALRTAFLQKPFTPDGLARAVRRVLDEKDIGSLSPS